MEVEMSSDGSSALWRRLDMPGHEAVRMYEGEEGWFLDGSSVFLYEGKPCRLEYMVECDSEWRTLAGTVDGFVGDEVVSIEIEIDGDFWYMNEEEIVDVRGCVDIDLNFSPVTNLLPIKRLNLDVGAAGDVRAAWLRFPSLTLEPLEQTYKRLEESLYGYRSSSGFETKIRVDSNGLAIEYADLWIRES